MQDFRSGASQAQRAPLRLIMGKVRFPLSQSKSKWGNFASTGSIISIQCLAGSLAVSWVWAAQLGVHPHRSERRRRPQSIHFTLPGSSLWGWLGSWSVRRFLQGSGAEWSAACGTLTATSPLPSWFLRNTFPAAAGQWTHPLDLRSPTTKDWQDVANLFWQSGLSGPNQRYSGSQGRKLFLWIWPQKRD